MPLPVPVDFTEDFLSVSLEDAEDQVLVDILSDLLAAELREARARYRLSNGQQQRAVSEILLPAGILQRIAIDILQHAENEPCGLRGCVVYIDFEESKQRNGDAKRRIGAVKPSPYTVNTFELYLTLRPHTSSWTSKLPTFLQNWAYRSTMFISQDYTLMKRKLFRSSSH